MIGRSFAEKVIFNLSRFTSFFLVISGIVTANTLLLMRGMPIDEGVIRENAVYTVWNILFMTVAGCAIDEFRRRHTVDKPLKRIIDALDRIGQGDFSIRLDENHRDINRAGFRQICRGINRLAEELSGLETLRTDFISNVSHELKTPLAVVGNYAQLLQSPDLTPEDRREYSRKIARTIRHLSDLISDILRLSKLENQQIYPQTRIFDLGEQLCSCMLEYEQLLEDRKLQLEVSLEENVHVQADPELLRIVWTNLFSNAIKFTPEGGIIGLTLTAEDRHAVVRVTDTGCGMTRETGERIFEKFYQGDTAHASRGNGLGLALVKRVMDITGGSITVASAPGKGSAFTVRLGRETHG